MPKTKTDLHSCVTATEAELSKARQELASAEANLAYIVSPDKPQTNRDLWTRHFEASTPPATGAPSRPWLGGSMVALHKYTLSLSASRGLVLETLVRSLSLVPPLLRRYRHTYRFVYLLQSRPSLIVCLLKMPLDPLLEIRGLIPKKPCQHSGKGSERTGDPEKVPLYCRTPGAA